MISNSALIRPSTLPFPHAQSIHVANLGHTASLWMSAAGDPTQNFDAQLPSPEVLGGFVGLSAILMVTTLFWWNVVIPQQRTRLAISKSRGEVYDMLQRLEDSEETDSSPSLAIQRWLFADWLAQRKRRTAKPAAVPFLKKTKWNSGDNPILVAVAGIMSLVLVSAVSERIFN